MDFKIKMPDLSGAKALLEGAIAKIDPLLNDYKNATKKIEGLGFKIGKMTVAMGNKDDRVFVTLAEALILAKEIHSRIESKLESMTLNVTLGMPPSVSVDFV